MIILALLVALGVAGCAQSPGPRPYLRGGSSQREFYVACFYFSYEDVFVGSVRAALNQKLAEAGIAHEEFDAANDQPTQLNQIEHAIASGAGALLVNMVNSGNSETADQICTMAEGAGIPVIFFNRPVEQAGYEGVILDYYDNIAYVGSDAAESGHMQGQLIGSYLLAHYDDVDLNGDGVISYASFKGQAGNVGATYRTLYSAQDASAMLEEHGYPPLAYFDESSVDAFQLDLTGSWSMASAQEYMLTDLAHFNLDNGNMIELVIANSDAMAQGAILALQTNGFNTGEQGSITIPVFGVDASDVGRRLIAQGVMTGTIMQDVDGTASCIAQLAQHAAEGRPINEDMAAWDWDQEHDLPNRYVLHYSYYDPSVTADEIDSLS
jgi:methyl-galactoside transport system substrate-binding protein